MSQQKCVAVARHVCRSRVVYQGRFKCSLCSKIAWATSTGRKYVIAISNTKTEKVDIEIKMEMKLKLPVLTTGEKAIAMANDEKTFMDKNWMVVIILTKSFHVFAGTVNPIILP